MARPFPVRAPEAASVDSAGVYIGPEKIIVELVIALIVLGPERLPQVARQAGRAYRELRRVTSGLEAEVRDVFQEPIRQALAEPQGATASPSGSPGATPAQPPGPAEPGGPPVQTTQEPTTLRPAPSTPGPVPAPAGDPSLN